MQRSNGADGASVHVIDHDSRRRAEISRVLIARGFHAEIHEDAAEFFRLAPDRALVLLIERADSDVLADFQRSAANKGRYYPVAVYAEAPQPELVVRAMRAGAIDYLRKFDARSTSDAMRIGIYADLWEESRS